VASHFTTDKRPKADGVLIVQDDIEVGFQETVGAGLLPAMFPEQPELLKLQFLRATIDREGVGLRSSPATYRMMRALNTGSFTRWALDYWQVAGTRPLPRPGDGRVVGYAPCSVTVPGPAGALPTVRYQMLREALQETEARIAIKQALFKTSPEAFSPKRKAEERSEAEKSNLAVLGDYNHRLRVHGHISQSDLSLDWFRSVAQMYTLAGELTGAKAPAAWDQPPK
jgi:hypothetical protein